MFDRDRDGHITFLDANPWVRRGWFASRAERSAIPLHDRGDQLGDHDKCVGRKNIESRPKREAHSETSDEDAGPGKGARAAAPQHGQRILRAVRPARHQALMAMAIMTILAGVAGQRQLGAVGGPGSSKDNPGFHGI